MLRSNFIATYPDCSAERNSHQSPFSRLWTPFDADVNVHSCVHLRRGSLLPTHRIGCEQKVRAEKPALHDWPRVYTRGAFTQQVSRVSRYPYLDTTRLTCANDSMRWNFARLLALNPLRRLS